jgi:hypothetical protein
MQARRHPGIEWEACGHAAMKKKGFYFILFGWFVSALLLAQQAPDGPRRIVPPPSISSYEEPLSKKFDERLIRATKRYKLTAPQQVQVQSILQQEQADDQVVNADTLMSRKDKSEEQARLFEESQQRIGAILNKHQKRKFDADEKTRAWMDGRLPNPNRGPF